MATSDDMDRAREAVEQVYRQADHYARVAARLLYDGLEAEARLYAARYARTASEAHQLLNQATKATEAAPEPNQQDRP